MLPDHDSAEASRCSKRLCMFRGAPRLLLASLAQCGGTAFMSSTHPSCRDWTGIMFLCKQGTSGDGFSSIADISDA